MQILAHFIWIHFRGCLNCKSFSWIFSCFSKSIFHTSIGLMVEKKETVIKIPSYNESMKTVRHYFQLKLS